MKALRSKHTAAVVEGAQNALHLKRDDVLCGEAGHVLVFPVYDAYLGVPGDLDVEKAGIADPRCVAG
eukprot:14892286-Heterocapsa_arctica.AAC.1